jgi:hypothetical protein
MIAVTFDRARASRFLEALTSGKPIEPPGPDGWTTSDVLLLAGVCRFLAHRKGPARYRGKNLAALPRERGEAIRKTHSEDLEAAIRWHCRAAALLQAGLYDDRFEPRHTALLSAEDGKGFVHELVGAKTP